jgi:hypothetical protein
MSTALADLCLVYLIRTSFCMLNEVTEVSAGAGRQKLVCGTAGVAGQRGVAVGGGKGGREGGRGFCEAAAFQCSSRG